MEMARLIPKTASSVRHLVATDIPDLSVNTVRIMVCLYLPTSKRTLRPIKMSCKGLYGSVQIEQRQMTTEVPIGFCVLVLGICLGLGIGVWQCEWTIVLGWKLTVHLTVRQ